MFVYEYVMLLSLPHIVSISGGPPPLMGNIIVDPNMRPPDLDSIVVSAEEVTSTAAQFDQRKYNQKKCYCFLTFCLGCEMYNSMVQPKTTPVSKGLTPVVMIFGGTESLEKEFPHMVILT